MKMKRSTALLIALMIVCLLVNNMTQAADQEFKKGLAYLLSGSTVYRDPGAKEPLFTVKNNTGVYVIEKASGELKTYRLNDLMKVAISVNGQAEEVYVWAFDLQYMNGTQAYKYTPAYGASAYGVILGDALFSDPEPLKPRITRDPSRTIVRPTPTAPPVVSEGKKTVQKTPTAKKKTPTPVITRAPRLTPTPVRRATQPPPLPAAITTQPKETVAWTGSQATFSIQAVHAVEYQWQIKKSSNTDWINLPSNDIYAGTQESVLTFTVTEENMAWLFRCVVTGESNKVYSEQVSIVRSTALRLIDEPVDAFTSLGGKAVFEVVADNAVAWEWQIESENGEWSPLKEEQAAGISSAKLSVEAAYALANTGIRCRITGLNGEETYTESVRIIINDNAVHILKQPEDVAAPFGSIARLQVEAENAVSYQWQYNDGSEWWDLSERSDRRGAATDTLRLYISPVSAAFTYRCVVTGENNTEETRTVTVNID